MSVTSQSATGDPDKKAQSKARSNPNGGSTPDESSGIGDGANDNAAHTEYDTSGDLTNQVSGAPVVNTPAEDEAIAKGGTPSTEQRDDLPDNMEVKGVRRKDGSFVGQQVLKSENKSS